jgi:penicillin-binding protein 1A
MALPALLVAAQLMAAQGLSAPALPRLPPITRQPQVVFVDRNGEEIGTRGGRYGPPVDIDRLPAYVPAAFVAIEDRRFWDHGAVDPVGMARALLADIASGKAKEGASTITQQLARNLFLNDQRTVSRKATEIVYALELEKAYSKKQILGLYLSRVYFGEGAYGLEAASERYFARPARRLTVRQAAMLAALMKSPTEYDPIEHPDRSSERTALVLAAMTATGAITPAQSARALAETPHVYHVARQDDAQYFVDWADGQVNRLFPRITRDIIVRTTLDLPLEAETGEAAQRIVADYRGRGVQQAAVISLDPDGRVRALIGGTDYATAPYDRAVLAHRQPGSSWKPFVYLTALEAGLTPDTPEIDQPVTIDGWSPSDYEPEFLGPITLQVALAKSINTVAASVADQVGRDKVAATARSLGIVSPINLDPAMALGTTAVAPLEMAEAYDALGNGGRRVVAYGVEEVQEVGGPVIWRHPAPVTPQVVDNPYLSELVGMMRTVLTEGTGTAAAIPGHDLAGKTGTTSDYKDAWFCGFTGGLTTVVWMGRDDDRPMVKVVGGSAPASLWREVMAAGMRRFPTGPIPEGPPPPLPASVVAEAGTAPAMGASSANPPAAQPPATQTPATQTPATQAPGSPRPR